jgi:hypothetical protein
MPVTARLHQDRKLQEFLAQLARAHSQRWSIPIEIARKHVAAIAISARPHQRAGGDFAGILALRRRRTR